MSKHHPIFRTSSSEVNTEKEREEEAEEKKKRSHASIFFIISGLVWSGLFWAAEDILEHTDTI